MKNSNNNAAFILEKGNTSVYFQAQSKLDMDEWIREIAYLQGISMKAADSYKTMQTKINNN